MGAAGWRLESVQETGSEKLERNKETPACQTGVMRDGPEIAWLLVLHVCVREGDKDGGR